MSLEQFEWFGDKQPSLVCPPNLQSFQCKIQKKKKRARARDLRKRRAAHAANLEVRSGSAQDRDLWWG